MTMEPAQNGPSDRGRTTHTVDGSMITAVIETVAARTDRRPEELPELNAVVDPDCLDELFKPRHNGRPRRGGVLAFPYAGYRVRITGPRKLSVEPMEYDD